MARIPKPPAGPRPIETLVHAGSRRNIPTAKLQSLAQKMEERAPLKPARYQRATPLAKGETRERNADLDPQIVWRRVRITLSQAQRQRLQECIYFDPPNGIRFNSIWQVSTQSRDVKDGKREDVSRKPEQVRAFRDTWRDGIHSYLAYLRDRLTVARTY